MITAITLKVPVFSFGSRYFRAAEMKQPTGHQRGHFLT